MSILIAQVQCLDSRFAESNPSPAIERRTEQDIRAAIVTMSCTQESEVQSSSDCTCPFYHTTESFP